MSKSTIATPYRRYVRLGHPLATGLGYVSVHRLALYEKIGQGPHSCHWCSAVVDWAPGPGARRAALVVDHLNNDPRDNAPNNLVPSCVTCNARRGANGTAWKTVCLLGTR
jgi:HNH endonuclease